MVKKFCEWARQQAVRINATGASATLTMGRDSLDPSAHLDIDTSDAVARVTVWESGACDVEIIDVGSEEMVYRQHEYLSAQANFDEALGSFFEALRLPR